MSASDYFQRGEREKRKLQNDLAKWLISSSLYDTSDSSSHLASGQKCYRNKTPGPYLHCIDFHYTIRSWIILIGKVDNEGKQIRVSASYLHNPNTWLGKEQGKMRQKVKSSGAVSLCNCTHRFRSSLCNYLVDFQIYLSFLIISTTVFVLTFILCFYHSNLIFSLPLLHETDCVLQDAAAIHWSCGLLLHKNLCGLPKITSWKQAQLFLHTVFNNF